jgi:hypothetical protein
MSTQFQHQQIYKATWISPNETILNQIDHSFVNANKKEVSQNIKSMTGPNTDSSHFLQRVIIKQKLLIIYAQKFLPF